MKLKHRLNVFLGNKVNDLLLIVLCSHNVEPVKDVKGEEREEKDKNTELFNGHNQPLGLDVTILVVVFGAAGGRGVDLPVLVEGSSWWSRAIATHSPSLDRQNSILHLSDTKRPDIMTYWAYLRYLGLNRFLDSVGHTHRGRLGDEVHAMQVHQVVLKNIIDQFVSEKELVINQPLEKWPLWTRPRWQRQRQCSRPSRHPTWWCRRLEAW